MALILPNFPTRKLFIMTVDVDGWPSLLRFYGVDHDTSKADSQVQIEIGVSRLLNLFEKHGILATFFVTGEMATRHQHMVESIVEKNHEIACHGLFHLKDECLLDSGEQERTIEEATGVLEKITGEKPRGFRAPCLRANRETFSVLSENDYLYDSSEIPTFIPGYYGHANLNFRPYWISLNSANNSKFGLTRKLLEIPVSVNPMLFVPLSAAWMRNLGANWVKLGMKVNYLLSNPVVLYVHPRDVLLLPRIEGVPWHLYRNVGFSTIRILDEVIRCAKNLGSTFIRARDLALNLHKEGY